MKNVFLAIFLAYFFSCKGSGSEQSLRISQPILHDVLIWVGISELDNQSRTNLACAEVFNKHHFFGNDISELCSLLRIKTPLLFRTCKALLNYLPPEMPNKVPFESKEELYQQLQFLSEFKLSPKRKRFAWQVLSDRYFNTCGGLITARNISLKIEDPLVAAFHATIDFNEQDGSFFGFHRTLNQDNYFKELTHNDLDDFNKEFTRYINDSEYFAPRYYIDINFLKNFTWISKVFNDNPTYEKISLHDHCVISYLSSALDIDFKNSAFNKEGIKGFLETNRRQKKLLTILKVIKKKAKSIAKSNKVESEKKTDLWKLVGRIFQGCKGVKNKTKFILCQAEIADIDIEFFLTTKEWYYKWDYKWNLILIKAAHDYCANQRERDFFIKNFENRASLGCFEITNYLTFKHKSPSLPGRLLRLIQARILRLPPQYYLFAAGLFFGSLVLSCCTVIILLLIGTYKVYHYAKTI